MFPTWVLPRYLIRVWVPLELTSVSPEFPPGTVPGEGSRKRMKGKMPVSRLPSTFLLSTSCTWMCLLVPSSSHSYKSLPMSPGSKSPPYPGLWHYGSWMNRAWQFRQRQRNPGCRRQASVMLQSLVIFSRIPEFKWDPLKVKTLCWWGMILTRYQGHLVSNFISIRTCVLVCMFLGSHYLAVTLIPLPI